MATGALPSELRDLVRRLAAQPDGLELLREGYLESVAVTLGVHPFVVEAAREFAATPQGEAELTQAVCEEQNRREKVLHQPHRPRAAAMPHSEEAEALMDRAKRRKLGMDLLLDRPPMAAAKALDVHPYLVFRARALLRRRLHQL